MALHSMKAGQSFGQDNASVSCVYVLVAHICVNEKLHDDTIIYAVEHL